MADPSPHRSISHTARYGAPPVDIRGVAEPESRPDPLRQALLCLETAGRRLDAGEAQEADAVLELLRSATAHLEQALAPRPTRLK